MSGPTDTDAPEPHPDAAPQREQSPGPARAAPEDKRRFSVLIVEKSSLLRDYLQRALRARFPHLDLSTADGEQEAIRSVIAAQPDLVLTGVQLREGHGFDLVRGLRRMAVKSKIIVLSGHDLPEYRDEAHRCGADYCLDTGAVTIDDIAALVRWAIAAARMG